MISILLWCLASALNACMDTLRNHFEGSLFKKLDPTFWNPNVSYKHAWVVPFTGYKVDAWHLIKSSMLICIMFSMYFGLLDGFMEWYWLLLVYGIAWNGVFGITYKALKN
jgi:hypothetical protein